MSEEMMDKVITTFYLEKVVSVRPDSDSKESKTITLKVKFEGATIKTLAQANLGQGVVVKWQNGGGGRKNYLNLQDKETIDISWSAPGVAPQMSVMDRFRADALSAGVDIEDKAALTAYITSQL